MQTEPQICLQEKSLKGLSWSVGAVGNATWSGAKLCDVLKDLGIDEEKYNHVQVFSNEFTYLSILS